MCISPQTKYYQFIMIWRPFVVFEWCAIWSYKHTSHRNSLHIHMCKVGFFRSRLYLSTSCWNIFQIMLVCIQWYWICLNLYSVMFLLNLNLKKLSNGTQILTRLSSNFSMFLDLVLNHHHHIIDEKCKITVKRKSNGEKCGNMWRSTWSEILLMHLDGADFLPTEY